MCGRYALAAEADEIPLQFWQQYQPDHHPSAQHDQPSTLDGQADSFGPVSEEAQLADRSIDGFRSVAGLPRESVGGLVSADLREAGLGRSGGGVAGELERVKRAPAIEWASEAAKARYRKRYNVAPRTWCPIVRREASGKLVVDSLQWGIIPNWSKSAPVNKPINARDDGIKSGSGMWSGLRNKKRCVVLMDGWYEWTQTGNKLAYYTKHKHNKLVIMAGLWDSCKLPEQDHPIDTFAIVTTNSNKQLSFLHGRMPVILDSKADLELWLSPAPWGPKLDNLLKPYSNKLECYKVPPEVGDVHKESPEFVQPVAERKGNIASLFAKQQTKSPPSPSSPPDLSQPALGLTLPTAERQPAPKVKAKTKAKVPLPSKIDSFFGKQAKTAKAHKRKAAVKSEEDSSDLEIVEAPAKKVKGTGAREAAGGEEGVDEVTVKAGGKADREDRGMQEMKNPA